MEILKSSLIEWIRKETSTAAELGDLNDGVLFYKILSKYIPEWFISENAPEKETSWPQRLSNLRQLKKEIDKFIENFLEKPRYSPSKIDFTIIARWESSEEALKLLELIFYTLLICSSRSSFLASLKEFPDCLVFAIGVLLKYSESALPTDRNDKAKLFDELQQQQSSIINLETLNSSLKHKNSRLKMMVKDMQTELESRATTKDISLISLKLETALSESQIRNSELQGEIAMLRQQHDNVVRHLKDEIEASYAKINRLSIIEKNVESYKSAAEKVRELKQSNRDLKDSNKNLQEEIKNLSIELGDLVNIKNRLKETKDNLFKEKERSESLVFALENKESIIKDLQKEIRTMNEQLNFNNNLLEELKQELIIMEHNSPRSDDMSLTFTQLSLGFLTPRNTNDDALKTINDSLEIKLKQAYEAQGMLKEDIRIYVINNEKTLNSFRRNKELSSEKIKVYEEKIIELEVIKQNMSQFETIQKRNQILAKEIHSLEIDKSFISKDLSDCKHEIVFLKGNLGKKDFEISDLNLQLKSAAKELETSQELYQLSLQTIKSFETQTQTPDMNQFEIENNIKNLDLEISLLRLKLEESENANQMRKEKHESYIENIKTEHDSEINRLKDRQTYKIEKLRNDFQMEMQEVNKKKDELEIRLKYEQDKQELEDFVPKREVNKLKALVEEKDKDIQHLLRANSELKQTWKESARMLKLVWKELGSETKRMKSAINQHSITN